MAKKKPTGKKPTGKKPTDKKPTDKKAPDKKGKGGYGAGKTVKDIISGVSRNIGRMKESTLRQAVTRLSSAMNKRLDRAKKAGVESPAVKKVKESGGRFSAKGKTLEGLKEEFIRLKNFFKDPTSTQKGWDKVKKDATEEAGKRGILKGKKGKGKDDAEPLPPPPKEPPKEPDDWELGPVPPEEPGADDIELGGIPPRGPKVPGDDGESGPNGPEGGDGEDGTGWTPPPGWTWNEETRSWEHPDYGSGWVPYEGEGGGLIDPITGNIIGNTSREYHDYDTTADPKIINANGDTEAGEVWRMVDSIARMDPRFKRRDFYANPADDPRMKLFDAIDDAWVRGQRRLTFEEARDLVSGRLDAIYNSAQEYVKETNDIGFNTYYSDDDW